MESSGDSEITVKQKSRIDFGCERIIMRTYFITGASSGFGASLAKAVLERGDRAVLTARRADRLDALAAAYPDRALAIPLDVLDPAAREAAVARAIEHFGRIDVLANVAGRGSLGAAEEFCADELQAQMDLNFHAPVELTRLVLPHMRRQGSGHILQVTSVGGFAAVGGCAVYSASKFALEGWSEGLSHEVAPLGIRVTIVEPGSFRTEFAGTSTMIRPATTIHDYQPVIQPMADYLLGHAGTEAGDPDKAANVMITAVESDSPPLRLILSNGAMMFWGMKRDAVDRDVEAWRELSAATAFAEAAG
jgi:NAD(P)-dependent dehydrogenase (short-subunit alcohol dehydrogenase family)